MGWVARSHFALGWCPLCGDWCVGVPCVVTGVLVSLVGYLCEDLSGAPRMVVCGD